MVAYAFCAARCPTLYRNESGLDDLCRRMKKRLMVPEMLSASAGYLVVETRRRENRQCQEDGKSHCVSRRDG